jgi:uncharacterized protein (DUF697 family)
LGELGFLSPSNHRTQSVECTETGEVLTISYQKLREIYFQNPEFGYFFLRLTSDRLLQNFARLETAVAEGNAALAAAAGPPAQDKAAGASESKPLKAVLSTLLGRRHKESVAPSKTVSAEDLIRAARRRRQALAIVERHANYSAVGGFIPLPFANGAAVAAIIVRMVKELSRLYGVPFQRNSAFAIVNGLMGGVMPTGLATVATATVVSVVPGYNLIGLAVYSVTASAYARDIGRMLVDHFESGATLENDRLGPRRGRRRRNIGFMRWARTEREWARAIYG